MSLKFDSRQRAMIALCSERGTPGRAQIDVVKQSQNFCGVSAAISEAVRKSPSIIHVHAGGGAYSAISEACRRNGVTGMGYVGRLAKLAESQHEGQGMTLVFDHAGAVLPATMLTIQRCAQAAAASGEISIRVIFVVTMIDRWDKKTKSYMAQMPAGSELLRPHCRVYDYGQKRLEKSRDAQQPALLSDESANLFEHQPAASVAAG